MTTTTSQIRISDTNLGRLSKDQLAVIAKSELEKAVEKIDSDLAKYRPVRFQRSRISSWLMWRI